MSHAFRFQHCSQNWTGHDSSGRRCKLVSLAVSLAAALLGLACWSTTVQAQIQFLEEGGGAYGLYFGGGGTVAVPSFKMPADPQQITVECRFKAFASPMQPVRLVSCWSDEVRATDPGLFRFELARSNRLAFSLRGEGRKVVTVSGQKVWEAGKWHHAAATWDGAQLAIILDGETIATEQPAGFKMATASGLPLVIGPPAVKSARKPARFQGFIADVAVWAESRTAEATTRDAAAAVAGNEPGLVTRLGLRQAMPVDRLLETLTSDEGQISPGLARAGWCETPMWDEPDPAKPYLHLFGYDLSAPPNASEGSLGEPILRGAARQDLVLNPKSQQLGVLWQAKTDNAIYITWLNADLSGHETIRLKSMDDGILVAGTTDPVGNLYYLEIQRPPSNRDPSVPLRSTIRAAAPDGELLGERPLNMSKGKGGFNIWRYGGRWTGSMAYRNGMLGLIWPRSMYKGGDGLNHQGAIAVVFSARDPAVFKNFGQISSHSFGNLVTANSRGEFLGIDLGDCYPRGIQLHKFTAHKKTSRLIFTYKVAHARGARNDSPVYEEISSGGKTFYQWSNDNNTYTELGGVVEGQLSYSVIFSTARSLEGRVLDNSRAFGGCDDPRDLAMIRVIKHFDKAPTGITGGDSILAGIPEGSTVETGGFFNYGGKWSRQRVAGVIWLTEHERGEAAHAPQPIRLPDGTILILWEKSGPDGRAVCATRVTEAGQIVSTPTCPRLDLRFNREGHTVALGDCVFLLATEKATGNTRLCFIRSETVATARPGRAPQRDANAEGEP